MARLTLLVALFSFVVSPQFVPGVYSTTFTLVNKCGYTVWPGILSNAGEQPFSSTGFALDSGASNSLAAPAAWGGRFWGRTHCSEDSTGKFSCLTGDCGSGKVECSGSGATPPATLAEFKLDGDGGMDFFDVSLVDGYNLPLLVAPQGGSGQNCTTTGCVVDLNGECPSELKVTSSDGSEGVACKSACEAFQQPEYCCSGAYSTPATCKPSSYSELFKSACPRAYSYAYDDSTSTFTCADADYVITFCPSPNTSQKSSSSSSSSSAGQALPTASNSSNNGTMVYEGVEETSGASASHAVAGLVSVGVAVWRLSQLS
ncbi:thaumatin-like protein 1b [Rhodamnia argentea]|uniref:Thaumatin-like protein 1b n=1 Tax=Rhodamnia argentea TaxID=178133 RepID=A0ABM3H138_9MYRT|nr:thaumatin-like protein 1b [Rhodamnia argentea]